jgi:hypothetical protein
MPEKPVVLVATAQTMNNKYYMKRFFDSNEVHFSPSPFLNHHKFVRIFTITLLIVEIFVLNSFIMNKNANIFTILTCLILIVFKLVILDRCPTHKADFEHVYEEACDLKADDLNLDSSSVTSKELLCYFLLINYIRYLFSMCFSKFLAQVKLCRSNKLLLIIRILYKCKYLKILPIF